MLVANVFVNDKVLQRDQVIGTALSHSRTFGDVLTLPSESVSLNTVNESDLSLNEAAKPLETYTRTQEEILNSDLTGGLYGQGGTSGTDLEHFSKKVPEKVHRMLCPFSETWNGKLD